jgi:hypothetical protein
LHSFITNYYAKQSLTGNPKVSRNKHKTPAAASLHFSKKTLEMIVFRIDEKLPLYTQFFKVVARKELRGQENRFVPKGTL